MGKKKSQKKETKPNLVLKLIKSASILIVYFAAVVFLAINIFALSQTPQIYYDLISQKNGTIVKFFQIVKPLKSYLQLEPEIKKLYHDYDSLVFQDKYNRQKQIEVLTRILDENPKSRDVLYSLSLLYKAEGDDLRAESYLQQAKTIDPQVDER